MQILRPKLKLLNNFLEATMTLIDVETLKQNLTLENIEYDEYSDEDLELLLTNIVKEIIGYTNAPINAVTHKRIIRDFKGDMLELDYYPVSEISSLQIGSKTLSSTDYILDETLGILYFHSELSGLLSCTYVCQCSGDTIDNVINPLVFDMIKYRLTTNFTTTGVMSSVKEGDVQVNYDTSTSLGNLIQSRINNLKSTYSIRIKVL